MRSNLRKKLDNSISFFESKYRIHKYRKAAKLRLKRMNGGYNCDKEYTDIVVPFWQKYNKKPKKYWYKIFADRESSVDPRYIPDDIYYGEIVPYYSNMQFRRFGEDKCFHNVWFSDFKRPETVMKNIAGVYYDGNNNLISKNKAIDLCLKYNKNFLVKPSIDSGEGRLIHFFEHGNVNTKDINDSLNTLRANFIFQEEVKQHEILRSLNESSLNTIRIVSFLFEEKVYILSAILRVGAKGNKVDNVGAGGVAIPILKNGVLSNKGVNRKAEWVYETNSGIQFKNLEIPAYNDLIDLIKKKHMELAHFKLIGWDFSISENSEPIFIEFNTCPGQNQMSCGPTFGDLTDRVLEDVYINRTLRYAKN